MREVCCRSLQSIPLGRAWFVSRPMSRSHRPYLSSLLCIVRTYDGRARAYAHPELAHQPRGVHVIAVHQRAQHNQRRIQDERRKNGFCDHDVRLPHFLFPARPFPAPPAPPSHTSCPARRLVRPTPSAYGTCRSFRLRRFSFRGLGVFHGAWPSCGNWFCGRLAGRSRIERVGGASCSRGAIFA